MKKMFLIIALCCAGGAANAECVAQGKTYTSCKAGYYLSDGTCTACAKGYYKSTSGTGTSCTRCPSSNGIYGTTASTASTAITDCYIPAGEPYDWSFSDTSGSGMEYFQSNCYYSE